MKSRAVTIDFRSTSDYYYEWGSRDWICIFSFKL